MPSAIDHQQLFNLLPIPSVILKADVPRFTIAEVNDAYLKVTLTTREQLIGKGFFEAFSHNPHNDFPSEADQLAKVIDNKQPLLAETRRYNYPGADGKPGAIYLNINNTPVFDTSGEVEYIIRSIHDVTDTMVSREQEELIRADLVETTQIMKQAQELANFGNWQWEVSNNRVTWTDSLYHIYGLDKDSFKATFEGYQELLHPEDRAQVYHHITSALHTKTDVVFEERIIRPTGEIRYLRSWGKVVTDGDGTVVKMIGACLDMTEMKEAEIKLAEMHHALEDHVKTLAVSEKNYSDLFHLSPLPTWVVDIDTLYFLDVNSSAVSLYGYSREEFLNMTVKNLWPSENIEQFSHKVASNEEGYGMQAMHLKKNGERIDVSVQGNLISFNGKKARLVVVNDITERTQHINAIEKQNNQLQKIAWIQSHMVRAPLVRIMGLVELFKNYDSTEIDKQNLMDNLISAAKELDEIIKDISSKTEEIMVNNQG